MLVHFGWGQFAAEWDRSVVCIGTFDGVHRGHQALIRRAVARASELECPSVVVTFDRHPAATLAPERVPLSVSTMGDNLSAFSELGVAVCVVLPFDRELAEMPAEVFLESVLRGRLKAVEAVVGHDFAFGHDREGTGAWLAERMPTAVVEAVLVDGVRVSSSAIRNLVADGRVGEAAALAGRAFALSGVVVGGAKLGRTLGYPTINLVRSQGQILPLDGVYGGEALVEGRRYRAAISLGVRPTVTADGQRTVEAYLLDFEGGSLYGKAVRLAFWERLRGEERFDSVDALVAQMDLDVLAVRALTFGGLGIVGKAESFEGLS